MIEALIKHPDIVRRRGRGALIQEAADRSGAAPKTIYALLRQYWQRGGTPNALLPDYKALRRQRKKRKSSRKKLGRPRSVSPGTGATINADIERMFRIVLDRHYLTDKGRSLPYTHRRFEDMYEASYPDVEKTDFSDRGAASFFMNASTFAPSASG